MLRIRKAGLCSIVLILAACKADSVGMPAMDPVGVSAMELLDVSGMRPLFSTSPPSQSDTNYQYMAPINLGGVPPRLDLLGPNCPEACELEDGEAESVTPDYLYYTTGSKVDALNMRCSPSGNLVSIPSNHRCWDCADGCGGRTCPDGLGCLTVALPDSLGSDCRGFRCDTAHGWEYYNDATFQAPICRRKKLVAPDGPPGHPSDPPDTLTYQ